MRIPMSAPDISEAEIKAVIDVLRSLRLKIPLSLPARTLF